MTGGSGVGPPTRPALAIHGGLVGLLALPTLVVLGSATPASNCCLSVQLLGLFPLAGGVIVLIALGVAAIFWRHGPLAIVDTLASSLGVGFVASGLDQGSGPGLLAMLATGVAVTGLAGAVAAGLEVRERSHERIFCTVALALLVIASRPVPSLAVTPVVVGIVVAWPSRDGHPVGADALRAMMWGRGDGRSGPERRVARGGTVAAEPAPVAVRRVRSRAPDAAAVLGSRPSRDARPDGSGSDPAPRAADGRRARPTGR
jgi:hypothetical protein